MWDSLFVGWLKGQYERDDPIGKLARALRDRPEPRMPLWTFGMVYAWANAFPAAEEREGLRTAAYAAWEEFRSRMGR